LWALELTHPLHPNTSDLIAWLGYILALSASSALLCTFSTSKTHPFCLQQIVLWPVSRRALWSVCKTKVGSDICFWLCCLADMILGIQCLVHLVTGAASTAPQLLLLCTALQVNADKKGLCTIMSCAPLQVCFGAPLRRPGRSFPCPLLIMTLLSIPCDPW